MRRLELPKICVSIVEPTIERAERALQQAHAAGAFCEIRLDALEHARDLTVDALAPVCARTPVLLTWRVTADGGRADADDAWRLGLLADASAAYGSMCDVEFEHRAAVHRLGIDRERLVLSHHDISGTGDDLPGLLERMMCEPAAVYKVASQTRTAVDQFVQFDLLARGRAAGKQVIAIGMGPMGISTRVLGPAFGAPYTYCTLDADSPAAPGQLLLNELTDLYRVQNLSRSTTVLGLVAGRTGYSLSPRMHNRAIHAAGLDAVYLPFEVDALAAFFDGAVRGTRTGWNVRGLSISNPFKEQVLELVDERDAIVERIGAANTVTVRDHRLIATNTDAPGALAPLLSVMKSLEGRRVGVIGTGGSARAALAMLDGLGAVRVVAGRDSARVEELAARFDAEGISIDDIASARLDVLINATPVGTAGDCSEETPVTSSSLAGIRLVYDFVYNPAETTLLKDAVAAGCHTLGGLRMLATQAALQFEEWTGVSVSAESMLTYAGEDVETGG